MRAERISLGRAIASELVGAVLTRDLRVRGEAWSKGRVLSADDLRRLEGEPVEGRGMWARRNGSSGCTGREPRSRCSSLIRATSTRTPPRSISRPPSVDPAFRRAALRRAASTWSDRRTAFCGWTCTSSSAWIASIPCRCSRPTTARGWPPDPSSPASSSGPTAWHGRCWNAPRHRPRAAGRGPVIDVHPSPRGGSPDLSGRRRGTLPVRPMLRRACACACSTLALNSPKSPTPVTTRTPWRRS